MNRFTVFLFILYSFYSAQSLAQSGHLIHINVSSDSINSTDTLGYWTKNINDVNSYYFDVISTDIKNYLIRYEVWDPENIPGHDMMEIEDVNTGIRKICSYVSFKDFVGHTYNIPPNDHTIENGIWLFDDVFGLSFLTDTDTLYSGYKDYYFNLPRLYHICGKVDHRYFVIARHDDDLHFVLADLSNSPEYELGELQRLSFSIDDRPIALQKVSSDLFLIRVRDELSLYTFESDTFSYQKTILSPVSFDKFKFRNDTLYFNNNEGLNRYLISYNDTTLVEKKILLDKVNFIDDNFKFALKFNNDSLQLYDISNERKNKLWDISMLNNPHRPIMKYPDIYIHVEPDTLGTYINFSKNEFNDDVVLKAYPNPFNASIRFLLKDNKSGQLRLNIFDILGQKVYEKEFRVTSETIHYKWSPTNLSSGIYWVRVQGKYDSKHLKIIYLK